MTPQPSMVAFQAISPAPRTPKLLITQQRRGAIQKFTISNGEVVTPENDATIPIDSVEVIEIIADRQEYNQQTGVVTATGNVVMRFAQSVLTGDRLRVNLTDRLAVARGNVVLQRGEQTLAGEKFEYYLVEDRGTISQATGQIDLPNLSRDLSPQLPSDRVIPDRALSDRLVADQPITDVTATPGVNLTLGSDRGLSNLPNLNNDAGSGTINRVRFAAETINFNSQTWQAKNIRLTNDPFSPPELELRAATANFTQTDTSTSTNKLTTTKPRLVIDDSLSIPLLADTLVFDRRSRPRSILSFGFDGDERGGLYIERDFNLINTERVNWSLTPQYFLQRALFPTAFQFSESEQGGVFNADVWGLESRFNTIFSPRTSLDANLTLTTFDTSDLEDNTRAKIAARQLIGNLERPHIFSLEYNYRDRLFNGSLGFRTVRSSFGGVITSPELILGNTGIGLRYQGSIQNINAETDREELLSSSPEGDRINLTRYQAAAFLNKGFSIWQGQPLPATKEGGLRYSPIPIVPYLQLVTGLSGVGSFYSNSEFQISVRGSIGIEGQLGHFSRSWFDYTGFSLNYSQSIRVDESPFLFDRDVDRSTISLGITQQIYGPIRLGIQTSFSLDNEDEISTDYILQYSRRTHNVILRYNPVLEIGTIGLQINNFNWRGDSQPLEENNITPIIQGVER
jgi:Protein of unknown function (DUF3769)/OstA-like protein